ncbi:unnamed protein product [Parnassius mnemosyne]|uniref:Chitin-binding type-2 domain-containing protein n=1 Tax=Parnassius mnemosyne TaxID=213953 RepID=A0AAV1LQ56_9NEOP
MITYLEEWYIIVLIIQTAIGNTINANKNGTSLDGNRHSRVSGRIVKLHSEIQPETVTCISEGFLADPKDCRTFYRCIKASGGKYTIIRFECGPGTVYDPDTEACNHSHSTKRSECRSTRPFQFIIAPVEQISDNDIEPVKEFPSSITARKPLNPEQTPNQVLISTTTNNPSIMKPVVMQNSAYRALSSINQENEIIRPQTPDILTTTTKFPTSKSSVVSTAYPRTSSTNPFWETTVSSSSNLQHSNECTYDGFIGDNEDCRKFYRCVNNQRGGFAKYEFMCSESTIWDDDIQSCNHPWAVRRRRCAPDDSANDTFSKFDEYYLQINKKNNETELAGYNKQAIQSPVTANSTSRVTSQINYGDRVSFHEETSTKKNKNNENKVEVQTRYPTIDKQTQYISSNSNPLSETQYNTNLLHHLDKVPVYNTNNPKIETNNFKCSDPGFVGDPNDCRKFYQCIENGRGSYTKYEFSCGEGTVWDKNIESCNHIWMVKECGGKIISNSLTSAKTNDESSYITSTPSFISLTSAKTNDENSYITSTPSFISLTSAKTNDENSYITSTPSFISDNNGNNFDGYNLPKEKDRQENFNPTTVLQQVNETTSRPYEVTVSREVCNSTGYKGSEVDCKRFYRCIENINGGFTKFEYMCDEGTVWDPDIEACNHAWIVKRCGRSSKNETKFSKPSTESTIITTITFIQTNTQLNHINNEYNIGFGPNNNYTATTSKVTTTTNKMPLNIENKCERNGFMADNYDCRKFYRCVENGNGGFIQFEYSCGEGTLWDSEIVACNHFWAVKNCRYNITNEVHEKIPIQPPPSDSVEETDNIFSTETYKETIRTTRSTLSTTKLNSATDNTADSNKVNICSNNGFIGDEYDCKKFYRCVSNGDGSYKQYEFSCGEGTVWDPSIEMCNHAWAVKRCGGSSNTQQEATTLKSSTTTHTMNDEFDNSYSTPSLGNSNQNQSTMISSTYNTPVTEDNKECKTVGFFADKNDCKVFYRCVDNGQGGFTRFEFSCGEGTVWDQNIGACNHASLVKHCGVMSITSEGNMTQPATTTNFEVDSTMSSFPQNEATITIKTPHISGICIAEGFYSDYLDCKKFYRCVINQQGGFDKYEFVCGEGTVWDQNIQTCVLASNNNNNCIKTVTINVTLTNKPPVAATEQSNTVNQPSPDLEEHSTQINKNSTPSMEANCFADGFYPNPKDCKKFFRCVNNGKGGYVKYDFTCGEGTIWVQAIQACDHEIDTSTCSNKISTVSEVPIMATNIPTPSVINSTQSEKPNTDKSPTDTHSESNTLQNNKCHSEGYYASPNDCRKFYHCVINDRGEYTKYEYICGEGTAWDADTQTCNHITNVNRCQKTNALEVQVTSTAQDEKESQTTENISTQNSTTLAPEATSRKESPSSKDNCNNEGYYGNKENCQKFYRCVDNGKGGYIKYDYICGEGTIWDQDILACNHPKDVTNLSCDERTTDVTSSTNTVSPVYSTTGSSSVSPATSLAPTETTMSSHESSNQGSVNCSGEENPKKPQNQDVTCTKAGYFPNPNDCKKFYRCVDWDGDGKRFSVFHFECGEGTIWNPALDTCNYEESVYPHRTCGSQSQTDNSNSETTTVTDNSSTSVSMETTRQTQESTSTKSTTMQQSSSSDTTATQSTITEVQFTTKQPSTSDQVTSTNMSSTTTEHTVSVQPTTDKTTSVSEQSTTTNQITTASEKSTTATEQTTTTSEKTTTEQQTSTTTEQQTSSTTEQSSTEQSTTTSEKTTTEQQTSTTIEQQTSSTTEQSSTEQSSTQTTESSTEKSTTKEETTTLQSTAGPQSTTEVTTEKEISSTTTEETTSTSTSAPTENSSETTTEGSSSSGNNCPDTESDQYLYACPTSFRRHPKYCNLFYQCLEDNDNHELKIAVFNCPNGTIYDESKIQCVEEINAEKKCQGSIAKDRRFKRLNINNKEMIRVSGNTYRCPGIGHFPFEKNEECSPAILKCEVSKTGKLRGFIFRCPENYVYWSISRRCEPVSKMTECKGSPNQWDGRSEIPVERKNVA